MSERIVLQSSESKTDVRTITRYLVEADLQLGLDFLKTLRDSYERLRTFPEMGQLRFRTRPRIATLRMLVLPKPFQNYLIIYRPLEDGVHILRVFHGAQNIDRIV
ncbi:MAG: type II toxin-antitoxin system RelE/ParE family toxin [Verrucomicrobia bacterium]|jgi:plasmid stabilization system protein ParE|nr:type II toxin-antitoxin system RelE/ParE family toxin [Verrucomicrobiota bacterium]MDA7510288.1 type II toxin-antitoxin system RelE/ParE family toxin [Verrucomicrobiota bacterium]